MTECKLGLKGKAMSHGKLGSGPAGAGSLFPAFLMMAEAEIECKSVGGGDGGVDEFKLIGGTALGFEDENRNLLADKIALWFLPCSCLLTYLQNVKVSDLGFVFPTS